MKVFPFILVFLILFPALAGAAEVPSSPEWKYSRYSADYKVSDDATVIATYERALTAISQEAVDSLKQTTISYNTSAEKAEVLSAYTQKPDGRRIEAPKDNFQLNVGSGANDNNPAFSDETALTVIFPEVAQGDTVVLRHRVTETQPLFPGHFSFFSYFPRDAVYDDVQVTLDIPVSLQPLYANYGLTEKRNVEEEGRRRIELTYQNKTPFERQSSYAVPFNIEDGPGFSVSSFRNYADIAAAYGRRANERAAVTAPVQNLADEITGQEKDPERQARLLYDWVVANISYAGNCIGTGAVVPRDLEFVLGNKMGDCKDHATLLQALFSAKGIASTQALVNAGPVFQLPKVPLVGMINHVINYLPEQDLYLDATAGTQFGLLPRTLAGKPVLLVDGYRDGAMIPVAAPEMDIHKFVTRIKVGADGTATGTVDISLQGYPAAEASEGLKRLPPEREKDMADSRLKRLGLDGTLTLVRGQLDEDKMTYDYSYRFTLKDFMQPGTPGAFYISPLFIGSRMAALISSEVQNKDEQIEPFICGNFRGEEDYTYEFPANMAILAVPDGVSVANEIQSYASTYALNGQTLKVTRTMDDRTKGPVCGPATSQAYREIALKAWPEIKAQIVYK